MNANIGRNDPCPCKSGKKYKKCCGAEKKMSTRQATVISGGKVNSLLDRISASSALNTNLEENGPSLKTRISTKISDISSEKNS
jgi:hypothetical protein